MSLSDSWAASPVTLNRANAAEAVFEDIRSAITSGALPVGSRLPSEAALAQKYGVSRPVVREALRSAQTLGLTRTRTGSGTYVVASTPPPDLSYDGYSARDLLEARPVVEVPAAGWAALRRTDEQVAGLTRLCEEMAREDDPAAWVALDSQFHSAVAAASGNAVFAKVIADARSALSQQSHLVNLVARGRDASNCEHRRIVEAIAAGSRDGAQDAMRDHLLRVEKVVVTIINADTAAGAPPER